MNVSLLVPNFRDVGETINILLGRATMNERRLLRGGEIDFVDDLKLIFAPQTIINLRKGIDREYQTAATCHFPAPDSVDVYSVEAGYNRKWIVGVLGLLAKASTEPPCFVHCAAGKDRTGIIIAAVLSAIGIDREAIAQDYELSTGPLHTELFSDSLERFEEPDYFRKVDIESLRTKFLRG